MKRLDDYFESLKPNTRRVYQRSWADYCEYCKLGKALLASQQSARDYLVRLKRRKIAPATIRVRYNSLIAIGDELATLKVWPENIFRANKRLIRSLPKEQVRPTALIPFKKVELILRLPRPEDPKGILHRAILAVLFSSGVRRSEALGLRLQDVSYRYLYLRSTKSGESQVQEFAGWAKASILALVEKRKAEGARDIDPLFSHNGRRISERTLARTFNHYCREVGVIASPHAARATVGTKLLVDGQPITLVQKFLRHKAVSSTLIYDKRADLARRGAFANKIKFN